MQESLRDRPQFTLNLVDDAEDVIEHGAVHILLHAAHLVDGMDDPAAGGLIEHIEDLLSQPPALHVETFESHGVAQQAEPQQMAVHTAHLHPDGAQIFRPVRHLDIHDLLYGQTVSKAVSAAADPADSLRDIGVLFEISFIYQLLQPSVDESDARDHTDHRLILQHQIQMHRLREHRMLGTERYNTSLCHIPYSLSLNGAVWSIRYSLS